MAISFPGPIIFGGERYFGAKEVGFTDDGFFLLDLITTPPPAPYGTFHTVIPISSMGYRRQKRTQAGFVDKGYCVVIYDDWGTKYSIAAERDLLGHLVTDCINNELPLIP